MVCEKRAYQIDGNLSLAKELLTFNGFGGTAPLSPRGPCRMSDLPNTEQIRFLNDAFRTSLSGGRVLITRGVSSLKETDRQAVIDLLLSFTAFNADNDPQGEHDFVSVEYDGTRYFAKIEYYDLRMEFASEDPSDASRTLRVMTIMRADEY